MKKIIILLITGFLLTGCNATYEINITNDKIYDTIKIFTDSQNVQNASNAKTEEFSNKIGDWERGYDYYKRELYTTNDSKTGYQYTYDFTYEEYDAMSQLRKCYQDFDFNTGDTITLKTSKEFLCSTYYPDIDNIKITINSDFQITSSNADTQSKNSHTWIITKENYKNKPIIFTIDKNNKASNEKQESTLNFKIIFTYIIFIILIIIFVIRKKSEKK